MRSVMEFVLCPTTSLTLDEGDILMSARRNRRHSPLLAATLFLYSASSRSHIALISFTLSGE
jgi:hypothetical protein